MKRIFFIYLVLGMQLFTGYSYAQKEGKLTHRTISKEDAPNEDSYKNFRFTLGGGYAYWIGKQMKSGNEALDALSSDLRNGYNLTMDVQYFFQEHSGIALNGYFIERSVSASDVLPIPGATEYINAGYKEKNRLTYVGAAYVYRWENNKWGFYLSGGFGPLFYHNKSGLFDVNLSDKTNSFNKVAFASNLSVSGERRINRYLGAGLKVALTAGTIKIDNMADRMSVSDLMFSGFISFRTK